MNDMRAHIGIYPGTFDPVHQGHIAFAAESIQVCRLDEVVLLPERVPREKQQVTDITHRAELLRRATADVSGLRVLELAHAQFTVKQTLPELQTLFGNAELTFLLGSDIVRTFSYRWSGLDVLLRKVSFAIGLRTQDDPAEIMSILADLQKTYALPIRYRFITTPNAHVASSHIRGGADSATQVHPAALEYIREHSLYADLSFGSTSA